MFIPNNFRQAKSVVNCGEDQNTLESLLTIRKSVEVVAENALHSHDFFHIMGCVGRFFDV